jgi:hypothetical protein
MSAVLRAQTTGETRGFMALVGASDDRILGFTMVGAEAGEVAAAVQTAMLADLPYPARRDAILAHPTIAEGLDPLFSSVSARSLRQVTPRSALPAPQSRRRSGLTRPAGDSMLSWVAARTIAGHYSIPPRRTPRWPLSR